ncbi:MAG: TlpA disulfide reductase family protein [Isosphaeraceae bacterium]|nr:TlpA disulfide reductase family protein [Isosphaeraceae bacterium]
MIRLMRFAVPVAFGAIVVGLASSALIAADEKSTPVQLIPVKWTGYQEKVASFKKAKLVIVDAWATWCGPCKENFPHLVEMHEKYADKGLAVVSLSLDDPEKPKKIAEAKAFLVEKKAVFTNLLLDESPDDAFDNLDINAIPAVFLYSPDGKLIERFTLDDPNNQFTYEQVEKKVRKLLSID